MDLDDPDGLRIGAAEREAAMRNLGEHLAMGRLEIDEFEHRAAMAAAARTRGDLRPLFADLPPPRPAWLLTPTPLAHTDAGHLPEPLRAALIAEGVLVLAAKVRGSITYRNYRAPGQYTNWSKEPVSGTVALTGRRLVVWAGRAKRVDVPFDHPMRATVQMSVDKPNRLCIVLHPHDQADWSGRIEFRFTTPQADTIVELWAATH